MPRTEAPVKEVAVGDTMFLSPYHDRKLPDGTLVSISVVVTKVSPTRITVDNGDSFVVRPQYSGLKDDSYRRWGAGESWTASYLRRHPGNGHKVMTQADYLAANAVHADLVKQAAEAKLRKAVDDVGVVPVILDLLSLDSGYPRGRLRELQAVLTPADAEIWNKHVEDALIAQASQLNTIRSAVRGIASRLGDIK